MKAIQRLFYISIIAIVGFACDRDDYYYLSEDYKSACLYYAVGVGDTIKMQSNNGDTLLLCVYSKTLDLEKMPYDNIYIQKMDIGFSYNGHSYYQIMATYNGYFEDQINIPDKAQFCSIFLPNFGFDGLVEQSNYADTISGIFYTDLYKTTSATNPSDYIITSRSQGIVYAQNDTVQYVKVY